MMSSSRPIQTAWHAERVLGSPQVSSLTTAGLDWLRALRRDIHAHMLLSLVLASVLGLLEEHGPLTTYELLALDPEHVPATLRTEFLRWLKRGWISRALVRVGRSPMYRYAITERGRAVLEGDRVDPNALPTPRQWVRRELVLDGRTFTIEEAAAVHGLKPKTVRRRLERGSTPEDAVRIGRDLQARRLCAMHWGTIKMTDEDPFEVPGRFRTAAAAAGYKAEDAWVLAIGETRLL